MKTNFKVGDRIMYKGYMYEIREVGKHWYDVEAIPPYDMEDGIVKCIGLGGEKDMSRVPKGHQMTVAEFIHELYKFNQTAKVCIGDNFGNSVSIGWSGRDGDSKENCEYVCLDVLGKEEKENGC